MNNYSQDICFNSLEKTNDIRIFKHDILNHIQLIKIYIEMDNKEKGLKYISRMLREMEKYKHYTITGNIDFDIILSSKIDKIAKLGTIIDLDSELPEDLEFDIFDVMTVVGNLLDNAYEALLKAQQKRLSLSINAIEDNLKIFISNTYNNIIERNDDVFITTKSDKSEHGIGLKSVVSCIEKNNGDIDIEYTEDEFFVEATLPLLKDIVNC